MATSSEQVEQGEMLLREEPSRPPLPSWAVEEPSEPMLTQEELDHIAYIEKLVEETSRAVEPPPRPAPPAVAAVPAEEQRPAQFEAEEVVHPRYADEFEREESRESEPTSGADQLETSDVGSPVPLYERTSPLLEEDEKHAMATSSEQEELDHIAYIEKLAKETSVALEPTSRPAPPAVAAVPAEEQRPAQFEAEEVVHPRYADEFEREESRESEPTSGADQLETSDVGSPVPLYERTSPLLEEDEKHAMATSSEQVEQGEMLLREEPSRPPLPSWAVEEPSEPMLTQEELDHIAYIEKL
ncbi:hypothetical protein V3C99_006654, partial [Haemonchus contortus]